MSGELNSKEKLRKNGKTTKQRIKASHVTEAIASRNHNNLYITSSFFNDRTKYKAFCAFYAVMRIVDDRIDNLPLLLKQNEESQKRELGIVNAWEQLVISCHQGIYPALSQLEACNYGEAKAVCESLIEAFRNFPVPLQLWTNFFAAMRSDLALSELENWSDFLDYAEGATVAPTTIYLYLIAAQRNISESSYELPEGFDIFRCGRYLGIFAYLGHIIRDLAEDIKSKVTRLCITREDMDAHNISPEMLRKETLRNQASAATIRLVKDLLQRARRYLLQGRIYVSQIQKILGNDGRFILELIITMYERILDKIESRGYDPLTKQHYLSRREKSRIVKSVALQNGFPLPAWFDN